MLICELLYADDAVFLAHRVEYMQLIMERVCEVSAVG